MTTSEQQRSIKYLAGRPEVPNCPRCRGNKTHLTSWGQLACRECSDHFTLAPKPEMAGGIVIPKAGALPEATMHTWASTPVENWVRCSDRLPADGRVYRAMLLGNGDWKMRMRNGEMERIKDGNIDWGTSASPLDWWEWLDEAPAQEGQDQREGSTEGRATEQLDRKGWEVPTMPASLRHQRPIAGVESGPSHPMPPGILTRAMRQRRAEQELLAVKRDFWRTIGRGRR